MSTIQQTIAKYTGVRSRFSNEGTGGRRYQLADKREAKAMARRRTTQLLRKDHLSPEDRLILENEISQNSDFMKEGKVLKKGLLGLASSLNKAMGIPATGGHIYWAIKQMDPMRLAFMYDHNMFIFDVVFDYEGKSEFTDFEAGDIETKVADFQLLIEEYDRLWS